MVISTEMIPAEILATAPTLSIVIASASPSNPASGYYDNNHEDEVKFDFIIKG